MSQRKSVRQRSALPLATLASLILLTAALTAKEREASSSTPPAEAPASEAPATADARSAIDQALDKPISIDWKELPLADAMKQLETQTGIRILLDLRSLDDLEYDATTPISIELKDLPLRYALQHALRHLSLTYVARDGLLLITTPSEASKVQTIQLYDVVDLLTPPDNPTAVPDYDALIELITTVVEPTGWDEVGGPGSIAPVKGCLAIGQTQDVHQQIAELLAALRRTREQQAQKNYQPVPAMHPALAEIQAAIDAALDRPCKLDLKDTPLADVVAQVRAETRLNMLLDESTLDDVGVGDDTPITGNFADLPLRAALREMLDGLLAKIIPHDGVLLVTEAENDPALTTVVYPLGDLLPQPDPAIADLEWLWTVDGVQIGSMQEDVDDFRELITTAIQPTTWDEVGGPGNIAPFGQPASLVVRQTPETQREIATLLSDLRHTLKQRQQPSAGPPASATAPATVVFTQIAANHQVTYAEQRDRVSEAADVIQATIEPGSWGVPPNFHVLRVGTSLVVRHNPATLSKVARLLEHLGFSSPLGWNSMGGGTGTGGTNQGGTTNGNNQPANRNPGGGSGFFNTAQ